MRPPIVPTSNSITTLVCRKRNLPAIQNEPTEAQDRVRKFPVC